MIDHILKHAKRTKYVYDNCTNMTNLEAAQIPTRCDPIRSTWLTVVHHICRFRSTSNRDSGNESINASRRLIIYTLNAC